MLELAEVSSEEEITKKRLAMADYELVENRPTLVEYEL